MAILNWTKCTPVFHSNLQLLKSFFHAGLPEIKLSDRNWNFTWLWNWIVPLTYGPCWGTLLLGYITIGVHYYWGTILLYNFFSLQTLLTLRVPRSFTQEHFPPRMLSILVLKNWKYKLELSEGGVVTVVTVSVVTVGCATVNQQSFFLSLDLLPARLHSSVGRASHRYRGGHGFKSRWSLRFFFWAFSVTA